MGINLMYEHNAGNNLITYKSFDAMKMFSMHMKSSLKHNLLLHSPFIYEHLNNSEKFIITLIISDTICTIDTPVSLVLTTI